MKLNIKFPITVSLYMNYMQWATITEAWVEDTTQPMPKTEENGMSIMTVRFVLAVKEASEVPEPICFSTKERI